MQDLPKDVRNYLVSFFTLGSKRALLQVAKWCYWWIKPHVRNFNVPYGPNAAYVPGPCHVCSIEETEGQSRHHGKLESMKKVNILSDIDSAFAIIECRFGHKSVCHQYHLTSRIWCARQGCNEVIAKKKKMKTRKEKLIDLIKNKRRRKE